MKDYDIFRKISQKDVEGLIVTNPINIEYLTGFSLPERLDAIVFFYQKDFYIITSSMYEEELTTLSRQKSNKFRLIVLPKGKRYLDILNDICNKLDRIGFEEEDLKYSEYKRFSEKLKCKLIETNGLVESIRTVKTTDEINLIKRSCRITAKVMYEIASEIDFASNHSESELKEKIISKFKLLDATEGFDSIVAFGANTSIPHHKVTSEQKNISQLPVLVDIGAKQNGYFGDMSRTFYFGKNSEILKLMQIVSDCKNFTIEQVRPGISYNEIHKFAVEYFEKFGYAQYFLHGIGHGLGLEIHEKPFASSIEPLEEGNVITIEPGLYFSLKYGFRDEDVVLVTKNGCEILTQK